MHSSGRGEESPEAYRGAGHPSGQNQPPAYGEHVQPAGGSPWGAGPEPADATQMLPPYPAGLPGSAGGPGPVPGGPVPIADATQMLPPYPGADPSAGPHPGAPGPVLPPQAAAPGHPGAVAPAEATRALPLPGFPENQQPYEQQQPYAQQAPQSYEQPAYDQRQPYETGYDQQRYGGPQQPPPGQGVQGYGQEYGGGYDEQQSGPAPAPQHDSDYDHLFRTDVPSPPPMRQRIIAPPDRQQQAAQPAQPQYGQQQPPYGQQPGPYEPGYGYDENGGRGGGRRMSPKVVAGIAVAAIVVAGVVVGGLLSGGGGDDDPGTAAGKSTVSTAPSVSAAPSGQAAGSGDEAEVEQQAKALDALLDTSGDSRSAVVAAVASVKDCKDLSGASARLRDAATQRTGLVTRLGTLSVDRLPNHAALTEELTKAWKASAAADVHYANWADQTGSDPGACKGGHARSTSETTAGDTQSYTATTQKKKAVKLWNAIAGKYGLTKREYRQL
ncbi:hypothetical protein [Actinacidiphila sp. ITFR-21]|uniref:hypothetical protein n=1 Tax=Actinacidiphila sp. ITFR-21 TaxID=3075199 RepID=UPI00288BF9DC|nr:hypothetical protein [Streptomyces sp. ITFR-21]WNI15952.1 hypothetical protein RLT57_10765 [Streptomyces sp. ITFR-21]